MTEVKNIIAKSKDQTVTVRFPEGLVPELDKSAKKNGRSRNTEVIVRLLSTFEKPSQKKAA
ncbi:MAG: Arc family DNA-binding protein [Gallionella sp.]|jgi:hypothetical protein